MIGELYWAKVNLNVTELSYIISTWQIAMYSLRSLPCLISGFDDFNANHFLTSLIIISFVYFFWIIRFQIQKVKCEWLHSTNATGKWNIAQRNWYQGLCYHSVVLNVPQLEHWFTKKIFDLNIWFVNLW